MQAVIALSKLTKVSVEQCGMGLMIGKRDVGAVEKADSITPYSNSDKAV